MYFDISSSKGMYKSFQWVYPLIKDILALRFLKNQNSVWVHKDCDFQQMGWVLSAPTIYKFGVKECVSIIYLIN